MSNVVNQQALRAAVEIKLQDVQPAGVAAELAGAVGSGRCSSLAGAVGRLPVIAGAKCEGTASTTTSSSAAAWQFCHLQSMAQGAALKSLAIMRGMMKVQCAAVYGGYLGHWGATIHVLT